MTPNPGQKEVMGEAGKSLLLSPGGAHLTGPLHPLQGHLLSSFADKETEAQRS